MSSSGGPTRRWRRRPLKLHSDATRIGAEHRVAGLAGRGSSGPRRVCGASGTHNGTAGHCPGQADRADGRALHGDRPSVRKSKAKRLGSNRPHAGKIRIAFPQQFEERLQSWIAIRLPPIGHEAQSRWLGGFLDLPVDDAFVLKSRATLDRAWCHHLSSAPMRAVSKYQPVALSTIVSGRAHRMSSWMIQKPR
jgi:hypothetical protein